MCVVIREACGLGASHATCRPYPPRPATFHAKCVAAIAPAAGCEELLASGGWGKAAAKEELLEARPRLAAAVCGRRLQTAGRGRVLHARAAITLPLLGLYDR